MEKKTVEQTWSAMRIREVRLFCNVTDLGAVNGHYFISSNVSEQPCVLI